MTISIEVGEGGGKVADFVKKEVFTSGLTLSYLDRTHLGLSQKIDVKETTDEERFYRHVTEKIKGSNAYQTLYKAGERKQAKELVQSSIKRIRLWVDQCRESHDYRCRSDFTDKFHAQKQIIFPGEMPIIFYSYSCSSIMVEKDC